ncbi:XdhC/CoxI family protein [Mycobacterium sp.]|uniref:XdhC family protein n=1 Tax=Mycobacterium sp. TaxID=1785 RepID=UPI002628F6E2|nr:XdhC/CoxI family protein [Mycobacterium sp.]
MGVSEEIRQRWLRGEAVAAATVVRTWDSAPRPPGSMMFVAEDGSVIGSVSGGCVESAVYELALQVLTDGVPVLQCFGLANNAFEAGLTCGGTLEIFIERIHRDSYPEFGEVVGPKRESMVVATTVRARDPAWVGRRLIVRPGSISGSLGSARADAYVTRTVRGTWSAGGPAVLRYRSTGGGIDDELEIFVSAHHAQARMIVFGAIDFAAATAGIGAFLGYHVTVCDPRAVFATPTRFPDADDIVVQWPHCYLRAERDAGRVDGRTVLVVLTHDPKFDVPLLELALRDGGWKERPAYVGAIGSRRTHADRAARLREIGLTERELGRLRAPIGLQLGAITPEETAVSIAAEIIADRGGGNGGRLTGTDAPIHPSVGSTQHALRDRVAARPTEHDALRSGGCGQSVSIFAASDASLSSDT